MLAEEDRPADLLNVLKSMVSFNHPLPKAARAALDHVTPGATLTTAWLPGHFEHMRAHPDDGTGRGAGSSALASMRSLLQQAVETEVRCSSGGGAWLALSRARGWVGHVHRPGAATTLQPGRLLWRVWRACVCVVARGRARRDRRRWTACC